MSVRTIGLIYTKLSTFAGRNAARLASALLFTNLLVGCSFATKFASSDLSSETKYFLKIDKTSIPSNRIDLTEGSSVILFVSLSPARTSETEVNVALTADAQSHVATRFSSFNSKLTIPAGSTSANLTLTSIDDLILQNASEDFLLSVSYNDSSFDLTDSSVTIRLNDNESPLGAFTITGITAPSGDSTADAVLSNSTTAIVNYSASSSATSYDVGIYASNGTTVVCAIQNTTNLYVDFSSCSLTPGSTYKALVTAKSGSVTLPATNSLFSFRVNRAPVAGSGGLGPWYVMQGSSITINTTWAASPSVGIATDPDGDAMTITSLGTGVLGTATNNSTSLQFTAGASAYGKETLSFTITDSAGATFTNNVVIHVVSPYTWTGASSNTWSSLTTGNWCGSINTNKNGCAGGGTVPGASDIAIIDNTCSSANCSPTTNYAASVAGIRLAGSSLSQGTGSTLTVGSSGWTQSAGAFTGSNASISISGSTSITGGTFTSTTGSLNFIGSHVVINSPTYFVHNSGTVVFNNASGGARNFYAAGITLNHAIMSGWYDNITLNGTLNVLGDLTLSDGYGGLAYLNGGTVNVSGNLILNSFGKYGTAQIRLVGSTNQTVTGIASAVVPQIEVASTGGTVTFANTVVIRGSFIKTSGAVDFGTSTLSFNAVASTTRSITGTGLSFYNLSFRGFYDWITISSPISVTGTLTLGDTYYSSGNISGTIDLSGNLNLISYGLLGSASITMSGNTDTTMSCATNALPGAQLTIAKTGGAKVSLATNCDLASTGQDLVVQSGELNLAGFTLNVNDILDIKAGATLTAAGGAYTPNAGVKFICSGTCNP